MRESESSTTTRSSPLDMEGGRALVEAWRASGMTGAEYCRVHHLRPARLHYWRERLGYPIRIIRNRHSERVPHPPAAPEAEGFVQLVVEEHSPTMSVDIVVGGGVIRVRPGFDANFLRAVIAALQTTP